MGEFELMDTGIFDDDKYFDCFVEYAKAETEDILVKITIANRGAEDAAINVLPTVWFREYLVLGKFCVKTSKFQVGFFARRFRANYRT